MREVTFTLSRDEAAILRRCVERVAFEVRDYTASDWPMTAATIAMQALYPQIEAIERKIGDSLILGAHNVE